MNIPVIDQNLIMHNNKVINNTAHIFDYSRLKKAVEILRLINHRLRREIIKLLDQNGKLAVTEIYIKLRIEQAVASQHLAALRRAGVVKNQRDGKFIFYSLNKNRIAELNEFIRHLTREVSQ